MWLTNKLNDDPRNMQAINGSSNRKKQNANNISFDKTLDWFNIRLQCKIRVYKNNSVNGKILYSNLNYI